MANDQKRYLFRHLVAVLVLLALDAHNRLRRMISRELLRVIVVVLSLGLLAMVTSSLFALRQITQSVQSLIGDSMVGLESSVAMRTAVRETQIDLLRMQRPSDQRLPRAEVDAFRARVSGLLGNYRTGVFEDEDELNARRIEKRLKEYMTALEPVIETGRPDGKAIESADRAARALIEAVEQAYQFNRNKVHASAQDASDSARLALRVSNWLWWSFVLFGICILILYLAYRWLALPETDNG